MNEAAKAGIDGRQLLLMGGIGKRKRERMGPNRERLAIEIGESSQSLNEFPFLFSDRKKSEGFVAWPRLDGMTAEVDDPFCKRHKPGLVRVEALEAVLLKPGINRLAPGAKAVGAALDEQQVIHIAQVGRWLKVSLNEVVKRGEVDVRAELACEITDG